PGRLSGDCPPQTRNGWPMPRPPAPTATGRRRTARTHRRPCPAARPRGEPRPAPRTGTPVQAVTDRRRRQRVAGIVAGCAGAPQAALISRLNPVIRGWSNYYSTQVSKAIFHALDRTLTRMLLRWAYRRHGRRPRGWVVREYWDIVPGQTWAFRCRQKDFRLRRHDDTRIVRHVKVQGTRSPFDGNW